VTNVEPGLHTNPNARAHSQMLAAITCPLDRRRASSSII